MIDNLEDQLLRDEGEILHAYQDSLGFFTIGVGHLIDLRNGGGIPKEISRALLRIDIGEASRFLSETFPWTVGLDEVRRGAMLNLAFNLGGKLQGFRLFLGHMQANEYAAAAAELLNSLWEKQVGSRAHRIAKQIETGLWQ